MTSHPVIIDAARTAIGGVRGRFAGTTVADLSTPVIGRLASRVPETTRIRHVIWGNLRGPGGNLARYCSLAAGLPAAVPGTTIDRQCGAGLAAVEMAGYELMSQPGFVLAGGGQSASTQPITAWPAHGEDPPREFDRAPFCPAELGDPDMGEAADLLAECRGVCRDRQDRYAARSHARAVASQKSGTFDRELVEVAGVDRDERPRERFDAARLARFRPVFRPEGTVTVANSCGVNDGASGVLLCDGATHRRLGVPGLRILGSATVGCDPRRPGWGVVPAVQAALAGVGMGVEAMDVIEINEAFAGQVLACLDGLGIEEERNCPQGGALALGHAWASSGTVLLTRLFSQLVWQRRGELGLAAIAIAGGMGSAMVVRRC